METILSTQEISDKLRTTLVEQIGCAPDSMESGKTLADLGADSLDAVEFTMAVEEEFGLDIPSEKAEELEHGTIGEWVAYIFSNQ